MVLGKNGPLEEGPCTLVSHSLVYVESIDKNKKIVQLPSVNFPIIPSTEITFSGTFLPGNLVHRDIFSRGPFFRELFFRRPFSSGFFPKGPFFRDLFPGAFFQVLFFRGPFFHGFLLRRRFFHGTFFPGTIFHVLFFRGLFSWGPLFRDHFSSYFYSACR